MVDFRAEAGLGVTSKVLLSGEEKKKKKKDQHTVSSRWQNTMFLFQVLPNVGCRRLTQRVPCCILALAASVIIHKCAPVSPIHELRLLASAVDPFVLELLHIKVAPHPAFFSAFGVGCTSRGLRGRCRGLRCRGINVSHQ